MGGVCSAKTLALEAWHAHSRYLLWWMPKKESFSHFRKLATLEIKILHCKMTVGINNINNDLTLSVSVSLSEMALQECRVRSATLSSSGTVVDVLYH